MNDLIVLSSLAKVYTDMPLDLSHIIKSGTMLINDTYHFQLAFKSQKGYNQLDTVEVLSDLYTETEEKEWQIESKISIPLHFRRIISKIVIPK